MFSALAADGLHDGDLFFLRQKTEHLLERIDELNDRASRCLVAEGDHPARVEFLNRLGVIPVDTRQKHGVCFSKFEFLLTTQLATLDFLELVNVGENDVADGLLRAVDVAEVLDVHAIVGCFDRFPGHLLDDRVGDNLLAVGRAWPSGDSL